MITVVEELRTSEMIVLASKSEDSTEQDLKKTFRNELTCFHPCP